MTLCALGHFVIQCRPCRMLVLLCMPHLQQSRFFVNSRTRHSLICSIILNTDDAHLNCWREGMALSHNPDPNWVLLCMKDRSSRVRSRSLRRVLLCWLRLRLTLGEGVVGTVHVATPGSVHGKFLELQLLIIPQHRVHIPPRLLLFRRYIPTKK